MSLGKREVMCSAGNIFHHSLENFKHINCSCQLTAVREVVLYTYLSGCDTYTAVK